MRVIFVTGFNFWRRGRYFKNFLKKMTTKIFGNRVENISIIGIEDLDLISNYPKDDEVVIVFLEENISSEKIKAKKILLYFRYSSLFEKDGENFKKIYKETTKEYCFRLGNILKEKEEKTAEKQLKIEFVCRG